MEPQKAGLFRQLNGTPAHVLIVIGLVFLLGAPLIPNFKGARVARAQTELAQMDQLLELDMEDLRRSQERERKADQEEAQREMSAPIDYSSMTPEQIGERQKQNQANQAKRQERETERQKVFEDKQEELKKKYDAHERKRALLEAQIAATGMRWHLVLSFLGNLALLLGLLVVTLESTGATQKVALVILLVAMFSALSGVSLNFLTVGSMGHESPELERMIKQGTSNNPSWNP